MDMEKVIKELDKLVDEVNPWKESPPLRCDIPYPLLCDALALLKEQKAEIRQLRLALDIAKGTCKGIKSGGDQFADMPTMQSAT